MTTPTPPTPALPVLAQHEFTRECRYVVVKIKDANRYLSDTERDQLERLAAKCSLGRIDEGKSVTRFVVVESDWPEYEPTWVAIEASVLGKHPAATVAPDARLRESVPQELADDIWRLLSTLENCTIQESEELNYVEVLTQKLRGFLATAHLVATPAPTPTVNTRLVEALEALKAACIDVLLPSINEAVAGGFKMETWTPQQMQFHHAVDLTEAALKEARQ